MSRTPVDLDFEPRVADWLEADPDSAPGTVLTTVLAAFPSIPQRRATRVPWRFPPMSTFAKLAVAAVVVIAVGTAGFIAFQPGGGSVAGSAPSLSPSPSPSPSPTPTALSSQAAAASMPPPLSETFTSSRNGISIGYPAGWRTRPATKPWTMNAGLDYYNPAAEVMYDASMTDHLFVVVASQPMGGKTGDKWAADILAGEACAPTEAVTIDAASGLAGVDCNVAAVAIDGRGYLVGLYTSGDEPWIGEVYDRAWFEQLLTTIDLHPEDAAGVSPSPAE